MRGRNRGVARVDIIIIIIKLTQGRISTLRDLAEFLRDNVNVRSYDVYSQPDLFGRRGHDGGVARAAPLPGCKRVLTDIIGLSESQAKEALDTLESAGFIRTSGELFIDLDTGRRYRLVEFLI